MDSNPPLTPHAEALPIPEPIRPRAVPARLEMTDADLKALNTDYAEGPVYREAAGRFTHLLR